MRLAAVRATPAPLFVYGTLLFPEVLRPLLGRVPSAQAAQLPGWRAAALDGEVFPVLVPAPGALTRGRLITGLTPADWDVLDAYEDTFYEIATVVTVGGAAAWTYTAPAALPPAHVLPVSDTDWDADVFAREHLAAFAARLGS